MRVWEVAAVVCAAVSYYGFCAAGAWMASVQEVIAAATNIAFVEVHCAFLE